MAEEKLAIEFFEKVIKEELLKTGTRIQVTAKSLVPRNTTRLRDSIKVQVSDGGFTVRIGSNLSYAPHVEFGTRPHIIRPKKKKALAFPKSGGTLVKRKGKAKTSFTFGGKTTITDAVFAKKVRHPGTKGRFFLTKAFLKHKDEVVANINKRLSF